MSVGAQDPDDVGEVFLTLGVGGGHAFGRVGKQRAIEGIDARIDLGDGALPGGRIPILHDLRHGAVAIAHDAAVSGRVSDPCREDGDGVARGCVPGDQRRQGFRAHQRGVAVRDDHGARNDARRFDHRADRVTGPPGRLLHDHPRLGRVLGEVRGHQVAAVADDDDEALGVELARRRDNVAKHAAAA